ncbi:hypothetical protein KDK77_07520 [bacterium]|nr:hypothetical protein [bacterium]MCP5462852.1 hypothetical protein [bacterium]
MARTIYVTCPGCESLLEVNAENGAIIKHFPPQAKPSGNEDPLKHALNLAKEKDLTREDRFQKAKQEAEKHKKDLTKLFEQEKERIKKEGPVTRPDCNPFELD